MDQPGEIPLPPESLLLGTLKEEEDEGEVELAAEKKPSFSAIFQPTLRPQGEAFNATRQLIKEGTIVRRATLMSASGTPNDAASLGTGQPGRSPTPGGMGETYRPAQPIESLLEAMLPPTSAFTSQLPASRFGSSGGEAQGPQQQSQTAKHVEGSEGKWANPVGAGTPKCNAEQASQGTDGGVLDPASSEKAPAASSVQASYPSGTAQNDGAAQGQGGSIELNGGMPQPADKQDLTATWQFQEVTVDGGVGLAFDQLDTTTDTSEVEQLYSALNQMLELDAEEENAEVVRAAAKNAGDKLALDLLEVAEVDDDDELAAHHAEKSGDQRALVAALPGLATASGPLPLGTAAAALAQEPAQGPSASSIAAASSASGAMAPGVAAALAQAPSLARAGSKRLVSLGSLRRSTLSSEITPVFSSSLPPLPEGPAPPPAGPTEQPKPNLGATPRIGSSSQSGVRMGTGKKGPSLSGTPLQGSQAPTTLAQSIRVAFHQGRLKPLNIAILVVGTRGDVQPFVGIGLKLKEYGHRVRIASHAVYREFVTGFGLEFYPLGGDPKVLSEFVVKHRGIMPGWDLRDALEQREQVRQILYSTWGACTAPDPERPNKTFIADAIVANPPAYGHTHCAEALNVPLHIIFTMPWTPTKAFPQPFARISTNMKRNNSKARELMNWLSYFAMEDLAWLGMAGMQRDFRHRILGLKTWDKYHTSHAIYHSKVPITYIWSPSLVPRPNDWPAHCEVVGFCSVELRKLTSYTPPPELKAFLDDGPPPLYIGFGSLVVDQPAKLTEMFLTAIKRTGLRAIIQRGWGGLGTGYGGPNGRPTPADVLFIDSAPHDWLFQCVSAVVHHGGAGTTATGLLAGKPTFIIPFFGDQPFWGAACARAGVGPEPVAIDDLTTERIVDALKELILPTRQRAAVQLAQRMVIEDGIAGSVDHIHRTIYGALVAGRYPRWMKPRPSGIPSSELASPRLGAGLPWAPSKVVKAGLPTSTIQELETEGGINFLRGILMLPKKLTRSVSNFLAQLPLQKAGSSMSSFAGFLPATTSTVTTRPPTAASPSLATLSAPAGAQGQGSTTARQSLDTQSQGGGTAVAGPDGNGTASESPGAGGSAAGPSDASPGPKDRGSNHTSLQHSPFSSPAPKGSHPNGGLAPVVEADARRQPAMGGLLKFFGC